MEYSLNILLANDEDIVHRMMANYLRQLGHRVDKVHNISGTLSLVDERDYELAFIDMQISGMDGFTLMTKMREISPETSVVIITENGNMSMAVEALKLGAADFLAKPIKLLELDAVLEKSARLRRLTADCELAEVALAEMGARYSIVAESVEDFVWEIDMNMQCKYVNSAVKQVLGYDIEEASAMNWGQILTGDFAPENLKEQLTCDGAERKTTSKSHTAEISMVRKDGSIIQTKTKLNFLRNTSDRYVGVLGITHIC